MSELTTRALLRERSWRSWQPPDRETWAIPEHSTAEGRALVISSFTKWCAENWKIPIPGKGMRAFLLRPYQIRVLGMWLSQKRSVVPKSRQLGVTTLAAAWAYYRGVFLDEEHIVLISRNEREAARIIERIVKGHKGIPRWVHERISKLTNDNKAVMDFDNGSKIESVPSQSDPARGMSLTWCYLDEADFLSDLADALSAVLPATRIGGSLALVSTVQSGEGSFAAICRAADDGDSEFTLVFLAWFELYSKEEYESEKRAQPDKRKFRREYPATLEEALAGTGNMVFEYDVLAEKAAVEAPQFELVGLGSPLAVEDGRLTIWHTPAITSDYVVSVDPAEGLEHGDFTVMTVVEAETGDIVAIWRGKPALDELAPVVIELCNTYNGALLMPERNNHGAALLLDLKRLGYRRIFRQRRLNTTKTNESSNLIGWQTSSQSKAALITGLTAWLRTHEVPDFQTIRELKMYQRDEKGRTSAPKGSHDDCVMALAIAVEGLHYVTKPEYAPEDLVPEGSFKWFLNMADAAGAQRKLEQANPIGRGNVRTKW